MLLFFLVGAPQSQSDQLETKEEYNVRSEEVNLEHRSLEGARIAADRSRNSDLQETIKKKTLKTPQQCMKIYIFIISSDRVKKLEKEKQISFNWRRELAPERQPNEPWLNPRSNGVFVGEKRNAAD